MKAGFIGCGNMGGALMRGILKKQILETDQLIASDLSTSSTAKLHDELQIEVTQDNKAVVKQADFIVLAVKPQYYEAVIKEIRDLVDETKVIISIAPGKTLEWLKTQFGKEVKLVRCMPNTPAMVGAGITAVCPGNNVTADEKEAVIRILSSCGETEIVSEHLMDAVVGVSGSSPAYVYMFIEAMADAAVAEGMPRAQAYHFAAQAVLGSAKMVLETGKHPGELKDMVCSPGGTTIEAVGVLEQKGMRSAVIEAVRVCTRKSREM